MKNLFGKSHGNFRNHSILYHSKRHIEKYGIQQVKKKDQRYTTALKNIKIIAFKNMILLKYYNICLHMIEYSFSS